MSGWGPTPNKSPETWNKASIFNVIAGNGNNLPLTDPRELFKTRVI